MEYVAITWILEAVLQAPDVNSPMVTRLLSSTPRSTWPSRASITFKVSPHPCIEGAELILMQDIADVVINAGSNMSTPIPQL